jgi:hypothetical protein
MRFRRCVPDLVVVGDFREVLPGENENPRVVPSFQRGGDLLLLTFSATHAASVLGRDAILPGPLTARDPLADVTRGASSAEPGPGVSAPAHRRDYHREGSFR